MRHTWVVGLTMAVLVVVVAAVGQAMSLNLQNIVYGVGAGAVLGLAGPGGPIGRCIGFVIGLVAAIAYFLLRLAALPPTWLGAALASIVVIIILTVVSSVTKGKVPMWAPLLGAVSMVGAYNTAFNTTPWLLQTQIVTVACNLLLSAAVGFLIAILVELERNHRKTAAEEAAASAEAESIDSGGVLVSAGASAPATEPENAGLSVMSDRPEGEK